ncbi:hypothetical protein KAW50_05310 [candidate division WOR-3 bacterium]|nr:hypothetical protein [candidate division WOR-3 bacterium]
MSRKIDHREHRKKDKNIGDKLLRSGGETYEIGYLSTGFYERYKYMK